MMNAKKRILIFSPDFFSYNSRIREAFSRNNFDVVMFDERCLKSSFSKALLKFFPFIFQTKSNQYYRNILKTNKNIEFDYILIIRCDMISKSILKLMKTLFPKAKLCLYLYDSKKNIRGIEKKIPLFDYVSSFDLSDCKSDYRLHFRPLFYTDDFINNKSQIKYELCFCGTIHSDRYYIINSLFKQAEKNGISTTHFSYLQSKFVFYYYKLFAKGFKTAKKNDFYFKKKTIEEISLLESESNVVLDIQHPKQTGLTMRTIEMIGAKKKIITTNSDIKKYDFYNSNNIMVINRKKPLLDPSFFKKTYCEIPNEIMKKYSINQWIIDILGD